MKDKYGLYTFISLINTRCILRKEEASPRGCRRSRWWWRRGPGYLSPNRGQSGIVGCGESWWRSRWRWWSRGRGRRWSRRKRVDEGVDGDKMAAASWQGPGRLGRWSVLSGGLRSSPWVKKPPDFYIKEQLLRSCAQLRPENPEAFSHWLAIAFLHCTGCCHLCGCGFCIFCKTLRPTSRWLAISSVQYKGCLLQLF